MITKIILQTPYWVWGICVYLLYIGIKATQDRVIYLPKLFIPPFIFLAMRFFSLIHLTPQSIFLSFIFLCIGIIFGIYHGYQTKITYMRNLYISLPGSKITLIMILLFFMTKYSFGVLKTINIPLYNEYGFFDILINMVFSGYLLGKSLSYSYQYKIKQHN